MLDPRAVPPVGDWETLSRFICQRSHFRPSDGTVKQNAFVPHPHQALLVNRDLNATDEETWSAGSLVANQMAKTLYGRADVLASTVRGQGLEAEAKPIDGNPNHVDIVGWPREKAAQKAIAQEIAAAAKLLLVPFEEEREE